MEKIQFNNPKKYDEHFNRLRRRAALSYYKTKCELAMYSHERLEKDPASRNCFEEPIPDFFQK